MMDRQIRNVEITPEVLSQIARARKAALVIFVGFFVMFVLFAPETDAQIGPAPAVTAAR
jgi:hypothetical protein